MSTTQTSLDRYELDLFAIARLSSYSHLNIVNVNDWREDGGVYNILSTNAGGQAGRTDKRLPKRESSALASTA
eukprot:scaffold40972_cov18-Prasinocladus_malaysianus.AAC.1